MNSDNCESGESEDTGKPTNATANVRRGMEPEEIAALLRLLTTLGLTVCLGIVFFFSLAMK